MVDNFDLIESLLDFSNSDKEFYFVQVIQRKKDHKDSNRRLGRNNSARLIKAFYINDLKKWKEYKEEIIALSKLFNARAGINLNKRKYKEVALEMMEQLAHNIKSENYNVSKLYNSVCGQVKSKDRLWILDIDDINFNVLKMKEILYYLPASGDKYVATIPTKSGFHIITKPFNTLEFKKIYPQIDIHKNNPTNLYIP